MFVQGVNGYTVINLQTLKVDFQRIFDQTICVDFTVSNGRISIPRDKNGSIANFGLLSNYSEQEGSNNSFVQKE